MEFALRIFRELSKDWQELSDMIQLAPGILGCHDGCPLLSAPGISIYPPQIYALYRFRVGGNSEQLAKYGLWNARVGQPMDGRRWLS